MRRLILLLALLLAPSLASADFIRYYPPASSGSGTWAGGAVAAPGEGPAACANPAWSFTIDTNAGFCLLAADQPAITPNGGGIWARMLTTGFWVGHATTYDDIGLVPTNAGAGKFTGYITLADQTADHSWVMPDATGDVAVLAAAGFPARTAAQTWAARTITASAGGAVTNGGGVSGNPTVGPDLTTTPQFAQGTADPPATCDAGRDIYTETDTSEVYYCIATNTWQLILSSATIATLTNKTIDGDDNTLQDIAVADLKAGTDGELITWDASGNPTTVAVGTATHVLTSNGAGAAPTFQAAAGGGSTLLMWGHTSGIQMAGSTTEYMNPVGGGNVPSATEAFRQIPIAKACTLGNFYLQTSTAMPAGGNLVITLRDDAGDTAVVVTIAGSAAAGVFSDTSNTVAVSAGEKLSVKMANGNTGSSAFVTGWTFTCS